MTQTAFDWNAPAANANRPRLQYFLGVHRPHWLALSSQSLFVSHRTLRERSTLPRARAPWALDSGGFSELSLFGGWQTTPREYVAAVRRYATEIGSLEFASQQDWMCEPTMLKRTGLTVEEHQRRTIANYLELRELAPELPWMPVVQGWAWTDYLRHIEQWQAAGVELDQLPRVGVGSVCRRSSALQISVILTQMASEGLKVHAFGVKVQGLRDVGGLLASADSMAWSYAARREARHLSAWLTEAPKTGGPNKLDSALEWYADRIEPLIAGGFCPQNGGALARAA